MPRWPMCSLLLVMGIAPASSAKTANAPAAFDNIIILLGQSTPQSRSPVQRDVDVHVMVWAPTALVPVPFLRLTHSPGNDVTGELFVWWLQPAGLAVDQLPKNALCSPPNQPSPVCLAKVTLAEPPDWLQLLADIYTARVCELSLDETVVVTSDGGDLHVRVNETEGTSQYRCDAPLQSASTKDRPAARVMQTLDELALRAVRPR